jgi:hypothetical protein
MESLNLNITLNYRSLMRLKPIDRTDRGIGRLNAALRIYRDTILPEAQNPERQILYWIDHSKDNLVDQFRCFALIDQGEVIGYLQYSYFGEEHIFFFEYLCVRDERASGLVPSRALKSIKEYLAENYKPEFTIVFEIARKRDLSGQWKPDRKLIAYFIRLGFRTVDFQYHYPILQSYEGEASYPADLMVGLPNQARRIDASKMRTILRCIYFKHYLRWDRPFLDAEQFSKREKLIDELYSKEVARIGGGDTFNTHGDDKRSFLQSFVELRPSIGRLAEKIFAPKLPRVLVTIAVMLGVQWMLGSTLVLIPFVLAVSAIYCLAEDSDSSKKLFQAILTRLSPARLR